MPLHISLPLDKQYMLFAISDIDFHYRVDIILSSLLIYVLHDYTDDKYPCHWLQFL